MNPPPFSPAFADECRALLRDIASGVVTVKPDMDPAAHYSGDLAHRCSNGWVIVVFNDCHEWDYIDHIESPDGRWMDFDQMWEDARDLAEYEPSEDEQDERWGWASK